jgi:hypothetical protein
MSELVGRVRSGKLSAVRIGVPSVVEFDTGCTRASARAGDPPAHRIPPPTPVPIERITRLCAAATRS